MAGVQKVLIVDKNGDDVEGGGSGGGGPVTIQALYQGEPLPAQADGDGKLLVNSGPIQALNYLDSVPVNLRSNPAGALLVSGHSGAGGADPVTLRLSDDGDIRLAGAHFYPGGNEVLPIRVDNLGRLITAPSVSRMTILDDEAGRTIAGVDSSNYAQGTIHTITILADSTTFDSIEILADDGVEYSQRVDLVEKSDASALISYSKGAVLTDSKGFTKVSLLQGTVAVYFKD